MKTYDFDSIDACDLENILKAKFKKQLLNTNNNFVDKQ